MEKVKTMQTSETRKKVFVSLILFAIWFCLNYILAKHHEMFGDEAQSWLLTKYNSLWGIVKNIWEEGHPWLYNLVLYPFTKMGLAYKYIPCISLVGSAIFYIIIILKHKWNNWILAILLFLPPFLYYYPVYARDYFLFSGFLLIVACFWDERQEKPVLMGCLLGLLASSHLAGTLCAGLFMIVLYTEYFSEKITKKKVIALICNLAFIIVFVGPLFPVAVVRLKNVGLPAWALFAAMILAVIIGTLYLVLVHKCKKIQELLQKQKTKKIVYSIMAILLPVCVYVFLWLMCNIPNNPTSTTAHKSLAFVPALMSGVLVLKAVNPVKEQSNTKKNKIIKVVKKTALCLVIAVFCLFYNEGNLFSWMILDVTDKNTCCEDVALWIEENIPKDAYITTAHQYIAMSFSAYLGEARVKNVFTDKPIDYIHWYSDFSASGNFAKALKEKLEEYGEVYLVTSVYGVDYKEGSEIVFDMTLWKDHESKYGELLYKDEFSLYPWEKFVVVKLTKGDLDECITE